MFWVSEQRLVHQVSTISRNSWMIQLEIGELERNLTEIVCYKEEEGNADDTGND